MIFTKTFSMIALPRRGEFRRGGVGNDGSANAVAADTHRGDAGIDLECFNLARVKIGQRRVHVIGAGGKQIHAIDLDAQTVIRQAVDRRQAGYAARAIQADAGNIAQQAGRVAGGGALRGYVRRCYSSAKRGVGSWFCGLNKNGLWIVVVRYGSHRDQSARYCQAEFFGAEKVVFFIHHVFRKLKAGFMQQAGAA